LTSRERSVRLRHNPSSVRRRLRVTGPSVAVPMACVAAWILYRSVEFEVVTRRVREASIELLATASTPEALRTAATVVLESRNGAWIAIRHRDSHGSPFYSSSVALCSDGSWLHSTEHYCGLFGGYRSTREMLAIRRKIIEQDPSISPEQQQAKVATLEFVCEMAKVAELEESAWGIVKSCG